MAHQHPHGHSHTPVNYGRAFAISVTLNLGFVIAEVVYGVLTNSLALLSDAGHNFGDVLGLLLAWGAGLLARRMPTQRHTYGMSRSTILAALANAMLLLIAVGAIVWEAVGRFHQPQPVASNTVMWVAALGIVVNGVSAWMFSRHGQHAGHEGHEGHHHDDINVRGAYLHMLADAAVSFGVVCAALAMRFTGWWWLDPMVSLLIALVIFVSTWSLLKESLTLALDGVPAHIDSQKVEGYLRQLPGVIAVHDLHIWGISTTKAALTVHLVKPDATLDDALLGQIHHELDEKFGIEHVTVQFELQNDCH